MLIHDYLQYWATTAPDRTCAREGARSWSYREAEGRANRFGDVLAGLGVGVGDRVAVLAKNCLEWVAMYYGAFRVGAVPVPLNFRLHPSEWVHLVSDAGAGILLAQAQYVADIDRVRGEIAGTVASFVCIDGEAPGWEPLDGLLAAASPRPPGAEVGPGHDLYQMYTSGTTGRPKGAVLTHAAVDANVTQLRTAIPIYPGDDVLVVMPLFHAGAAVGMFVDVASGVTMHIMSDFDPVACVRALDEQGIVMTTFVPAMIQAMLVYVPDVRRRRYERLRAIAYGASPIAEETLRQALEVFGCDFHQAYGQTESTAVLTILGPEAHRRALEGHAGLLLSCGRPLVGTRVAVVDIEGTPVEPGVVGEIVARGPQVMRGYWGRAEATASTLAGGWLHTGDAGYLDAEGYLYICDRVKDMILSGGENIYPKEIEDVLFQLAEVADAAVIGVPDDRWGETVKAIVVRRQGADLTGERVIAWCGDRLAGYKRPRSVDFLDELPRNATGKVLKTVLREPYWKGHARRVG